MTDDQPLFTLADAHALARLAHEGQTDKLGVAYIEHVEAVAAGLVDFDLDIQIAGMLHDIVEDCDITLDELRQRGVSNDRSRRSIWSRATCILSCPTPRRSGLSRLAGCDAGEDLGQGPQFASRPGRGPRGSGRPVDTRYAEARVVLYEAAPPAAVAQILSRIAPSLLPAVAAGGGPVGASTAAGRRFRHGRAGTRRLSASPGTRLTRTWITSPWNWPAPLWPGRSSTRKSPRLRSLWCERISRL